MVTFDCSGFVAGVLRVGFLNPPLSNELMWILSNFGMCAQAGIGSTPTWSERNAFSRICCWSQSLEQGDEDAEGSIGEVESNMLN